MIVRLIAFCGALLLAGCAARHELTPSRDWVTSMQAVATVATNRCEAAVAPLITRLAVSRFLAARRVTDQRLAVGDAIEVQRLADQARAVLDAACVGLRDVTPVEAMAQAQALQARIDQLLETRR